MKRIIKLTESDLARIVQRVISEENNTIGVEGKNDPQDLNSHFQYVEKKLIPRGFKKDTSMAKTMGTITLSKEGQGGVDQNGVMLIYVSPSHPYSKNASYVIRLVASKNGKKIVAKDWKSSPDLEEVLSLTQKYHDEIFK